MTIALIALSILLILMGGLWLLRIRDWWAERAEWLRLGALQPRDPERFDPEMVADLPEPARRYFAYMIRPGTPLLPVAEIYMTGRFSLGTRDSPGYRPMAARQILAAPHGFVWVMRLTGGLPVSGSDSGGWTRFRILGLITVARLGGTRDHARSAYGRCVAEAAYWTPAALLPGPGIAWDAVDGDTARVTVTRDDLSQSVEIAVDAEGRPREVSFQRWSDANAEKTFRLQPFGGVASDFRPVGGYRLPFRVEAGNMFGTDHYFPFFIAEVTAIRMPGAQAG